MKFRLILAMLIVMVLVAPLMSATITSDNLKIRIYTTDNITSDNTNLTFKISFISSEYIGNNKNFTFNVNVSDNVLKKLYDSENFDYVVSSDTTTVNLDYYVLWNQTNTQLTACKIQRGQFETAYNKCLSDIGVYTGANATICKTKLETCSLDLKQKDLDLSAKDDQIATVKKEDDATKNSKWMYGIVGLIAGILGLLFYQGKLGGNTRDKSMGEFNPSQAG